MFNKGRPRKHVVAGYFTYEKKGMRLTYAMTPKGPLKRVDDIDILRQRCSQTQSPQDFVSTEGNNTASSNTQSLQPQYSDNSQISSTSNYTENNNTGQYLFNTIDCYSDVDIHNRPIDYMETQSINDTLSLDYPHDFNSFDESFLNSTYLINDNGVNSFVENHVFEQCTEGLTDDLKMNFDEDDFFQI